MKSALSRFSGVHFETVHREVHVAALECGDQRFEGRVFAFDGSAQFPFEGADDIDLEADA